MLFENALINDSMMTDDRIEAIKQGMEERRNWKWGKIDDKILAVDMRDTSNEIGFIKNQPLLAAEFIELREDNAETVLRTFERYCSKNHEDWLYESHMYDMLRDNIMKDVPAGASTINLMTEEPFREFSNFMERTHGYAYTGVSDKYVPFATQNDWFAMTLPELESLKETRDLTIPECSYLTANNFADKFKNLPPGDRTQKDVEKILNDFEEITGSGLIDNYRTDYAMSERIRSTDGLFGKVKDYPFSPRRKHDAISILGNLETIGQKMVELGYYSTATSIGYCYGVLKALGFDHLQANNQGDYDYYGGLGVKRIAESCGMTTVQLEDSRSNAEIINNLRHDEGQDVSDRDYIPYDMWENQRFSFENIRDDAKFDRNYILGLGGPRRDHIKEEDIYDTGGCYVSSSNLIDTIYRTSINEGVKDSLKLAGTYGACWPMTAGEMMERCCITENPFDNEKELNYDNLNDFKKGWVDAGGDYLELNKKVKEFVQKYTEQQGGNENV